MSKDNSKDNKIEELAETLAGVIEEEPAKKRKSNSKR